jgi:hypothetical protein
MSTRFLEPTQDALAETERADVVRTIAGSM